jgi:hypothetical protein
VCEWGCDRRDLRSSPHYRCGNAQPAGCDRQPQKPDHQDGGQQEEQQQACGERPVVLAATFFAAAPLGCESSFAPSNLLAIPQQLLLQFGW